MNQEIEHKANRLLDNELSIRIFWSEPPQTCIVPFMKSKTEHFFSVLAFVIPSALNLDTLAFIITHLVESLTESGLLAGLKAVEVLFCIREGKGSQRILRFSVHDRALKEVSALLPSDLLKPNPKDGITSGWYVSPPVISS